MAISLAYIYAALLFAGGLQGFLAKGSLMSLVAAGVSAALVAGSEFAGPSFAYGNILQMLTAGALTAVMSQRYLDKQKIMPAGLVAGISFFMFLVFLAPLLKGGKPRTA